MSYPQADLDLVFTKAFKDKRILVTGHTGFKGSWLCEWLLECGAEVRGYALPPETDPNLFELLGLASRLHHQVADIRDRGSVREAVLAFQPEFVFHLAAQPLVMLSYEDPVRTFETNVTGTINLLEALRELGNPCIGILVTSDKCYRNDNSGRAFTETDPLGGSDPYSASKGAMEIVAHSYRKSFFSKSPVRLASVRAGNVIGGGDYAQNRIVPDCVNSLERRLPVPVRNPAHTRPWQHVLEPLSGYLWLATRMAEGWVDPQDLYTFNFGPADEGHRDVQALVEAILTSWPGSWEDLSSGSAPAESSRLALSVERARKFLGWEPRWDFDETVRQTISWYKSAFALRMDDHKRHVALTHGNIRKFSKPHA